MNHVERRRSWFARGREIGATHLIVKTDTFAWPMEDFPDYVMPGDSVLEKSACDEFERLSAVYDLAGDADAQMREEFSSAKDARDGSSSSP